MIRLDISVKIKKERRKGKELNIDGKKILTATVGSAHIDTDS